MDIIGRKIIAIGKNYITLDDGRNIYVDKTEFDLLEEELKS